ncbi:MAG: NAD(P)H-binding protein, partial [Nitriliruptoraceae bacterium]
LHGVVRSVDLCVARGIRRFLLLSSWNAGDPMRGPREDRRHYYAAKHAADRILVCSGLEHTIVRPGRLTDDDPCGRVRIGTDLERPGEIPRADLATVMATCLVQPATVGATFEVVTGDDRIATAVTRSVPDGVSAGEGRT